MSASEKELEILLDLLKLQIQSTRLPVVEPDVFTGNILSYIPWRNSFDTLVLNKPYSSAEKVSYLFKYISDDIKKLVSWYSILPSNEALEQILDFLDERYGDPRLIALAYREKLEAWPLISEYDGPALRRFSDFLLECKRVQSCNVYLHILDNEFESQKILSKLPRSLVLEWIRVVHDWREKNHDDYPAFGFFASFLKKESDIACDPLLESVLNTKQPNDISDEGVRNCKSHVDSEQCFLCNEYHSLHLCDNYLNLNLSERRQLCVRYRLCFLCLTQNHRASQCKQGHNCIKCDKNHSETLHGAFGRYKKQGPSLDRVIKDSFSVQEEIELTSPGNFVSVGCQTDVGTNTMIMDQVSVTSTQCQTDLVMNCNANCANSEVTEFDLDLDVFHDCNSILVDSGCIKENNDSEVAAIKRKTDTNADTIHIGFDKQPKLDDTDVLATGAASVSSGRKVYSSVVTSQKKPNSVFGWSKFLLWFIICTLTPMLAFSMSTEAFDEPFVFVNVKENDLMLSQCVYKNSSLLNMSTVSSLANLDNDEERLVTKQIICKMQICYETMINGYFEPVPSFSMITLFIPSIHA